MTLEWQEIDKLRQNVGTLQRQISRQEIKLSNKPILQVGNIIATDITNPRYALQEIGVDSEKEEAHIKVGLIGDDPGPTQSKSPHSFLVDSEGNKFLLPDSNRVILIRDNGNGTGKQVEVDIDGNVTFPPETESKNLVVAEPASQFHGENYPWKIGRLIPGIQLVSTSGVSFFLVFCQGFGEATETSSIEVLDSTIEIQHDTAGHIIQVEIAGPFDNFWTWGEIGGIDQWLKLDSDGGPCNRTDHCAFFGPGSNFYVYGGKDWNGNVLKDLWRYSVHLNTWELITDNAEMGYRYGGVSDTGGNNNRIYVGGGFDENGNELQDLWALDWISDLWSQRVNCPVKYSYTNYFNNGGYIDLHRPNFPGTIYRFLYRAPPLTDAWTTHVLGGDSPDSVDFSAMNISTFSGGEVSGLATDQFYSVPGANIVILANMPGKRKRHNMASFFSSGTPKIIVFGGIDEFGVVKNTTYAFNLLTSTWVTESPPLSPQTRWGHTMLGDLGVKIYLFGGKPTA